MLTVWMLFFVTDPIAGPRFWPSTYPTQEQCETEIKFLRLMADGTYLNGKTVKCVPVTKPRNT